MSLKSVVRRAAAPLINRLDARAAHQARLALDAAQTSGSTTARDEQASTVPTEIADSIAESLAAATAALGARERVFVPPIANVTLDDDAPFMEFATCSAADMMHPQFARLLELIHLAPTFHRKQWEFGYILHHLLEHEVVAPGARGIGFGVGLERLPAAFAQMGSRVVATDAPADLVEGVGWTETGEHSTSVDDLPNPGICDDEEFHRLVSYRPVDMNNIDDDLTGFDFCWSACCFEHLGSIRHGLDFVKNSVEKCLVPGGIAVHTTELNLSSNDDTIESPDLSLFRRSDLQSLIDDLRADGHTVSDLIVAPDSHYLDQYVDLPPFSSAVHLKLELAGFVSTSVGIVVQKKR